MQEFKINLSEIHMLIQAAENNVKLAGGSRDLIISIDGNQLKINQTFNKNEELKILKTVDQKA